MKNEISTIINVKDSKIGILRIDNIDYISLTDMAKLKNSDAPADVIKIWMRTRTTLNFLGLWEKLYNVNFKLVSFNQFKKEFGLNHFTMSPKKWIANTDAIGLISKSGKYGGGTFAHPDIAFEFASWIDPSFKLYLIKEFERLKTNEAYQQNIEWNVRRLISKTNYTIHTDAIKDKLILPILTKEQINYTYASEADVLNIALFGMTASEWRERNKDKKGNMRDYATIEQLIVLSNMESSNSIMIRDNIPQRERLKKLNENAITQLKSIRNNASIKKLNDF